MTTLRVLGPVRIATPAGEVALPGAKQRLLAAALAAHGRGVVSVDVLTEVLWPDRRPADPAHALENQISRLRGLFGAELEAIRRTANGYQLAVEKVDVDARRFEELVARGRRVVADGRPAQGLALLRSAEDLWCGPPFADVPDTPVVATEISRLEALRRRGEDARFDAALALGQHEDVLDELARRVAEDPLDERRRVQLMVALYRSGRQADALTTYEDAARVLSETLGVDPGPDLQAVHLAILRQDLPPPKAVGQEGGDRSRPFVGREAQVEAWRRLADRLRNGRGGALLVSGEPGIGKSRLLEEVALSGADLGFEISWGRCREEADAPPYWPWMQVVRSLRDSGYAVEGLPAAVLDGAGANDQRRSPESERFRLFDEMADLFVKTSRSRPLVVILDDLHAVDRSSLQLLDVCADMTRRAAVGFVGAYRAGDAERRGIHQRLTGVARAGELLALDGLTPAQTTELLEHLLGAEPPAGLVARIHDAGDGNPLFTTELARDLPQGRIADGSGLRPPPVLDAVIRERLDALAPTVRRCLEAMAVLGRQAGAGAVAAVADLDHDTVGEAMANAVAAGIVRRLDHNAYRFVHVLFRDLLENELPVERRLDLHERSASWLEALPAGQRRERLPELVHHHVVLIPRLGAGPAVSWLRRAADAAADDLAWEQATDLYASALEQSSDPEARAELLLRQAEMRRRSGEGLDAMAVFRAAYEAAEAAGRWDLMAQAAVGCDDACWRGAGFDDYGPVIGLLEGALAGPAGEDTPTQAALLARLSRAAHYWDAERAREAGLAAGELVGELTDPADVAVALEGHRWGLWIGRDRPRFAERLELSERMLACAHAAGDHELVVRALLWKLHDLLEAGDVPAVDAALPRLADLAASTHQPRYVDWARVCEAMQLVRRGRYDAAHELQDGLLERAQRLRDGNVIAVVMGQRVIETIDRGQVGDLPVDDFLAEYVAASPALGKSVRPLLPLLKAELGDSGQAREVFVSLAADGFATIPPTLLWSAGVTGLGLAAPQVGDRDAAAALVELLRPWAGTIPMSGPDVYFWGVDLGLGAAALAAGQHLEARRHLTDACALHERIDAPAWLARSRLHRAEALLDGPDPDPSQARTLLEACLATSERLDLRALGSRAQELLAGL